MACQGSVNLAMSRPFGALNQRRLTEELWAKVEVWMNEAFGGNAITAEIPAPAIQSWNYRSRMKSDVQAWNNILSIPHPLEHLSGSDAKLTDPRLVQHEIIYRNVKNKLSQNLDEFCQHCRQHLTYNRREEFFADYAAKAGRYHVASNNLNSICDVINNAWVPFQKEEQQVFSIFQLCQIVWREKVLRKVGFHLRAHLTTLITQERTAGGLPANAEVVKNTLVSLVNSKYHSYHEISEAEDLRDLYESKTTPESKKRFLETHNFYVYFGNEYLAQTTQYVTDQITILHANTGLTNLEFMNSINTIIRFEELSAQRGFHPDLIGKLGNLLTEKMISPSADRFFPLLNELLRNNSRNDFVATFELLSRVGGETSARLAAALENAFFLRGQEKIAELSTANNQYVVPNPIRFGDGMLRFYDESRRFIKLAMKDTTNFYTVMNSGIRRALADNEISQREPDRVAILIAQYLDYKMTKFNPSVAITEIPKAVNKIALILQLLGQRDQFFEMLSFHFGKRLLRETSIGIPFELEMLEVLHSTVNMAKEDFEIMLSDYNASEAVTNSFLQSRAGKAGANGVTSFPINSDTLKVHCLTRSAWAPFFVTVKPTSSAWILPQETQTLVTQIKEHYETAHDSKVVTHLVAQMQTDVSWSLGDRTFSLTNCNAPMFIVLTYFGAVDAASYAEIQEATGLDEPNLRSVLDSLCRPVPRPNLPTRGRRNRNQQQPTENDFILTKSDATLTPQSLIQVNENFNVPFPIIDLSKANKIY